MISMVQPLPAGNAVRLFLTPPAGATYWRVLRMGSDDFTGPNDLDFAMLAYEGDEKVILDRETAGLPNGTMLFWKPYYRMPDGSWQAGATANGTPAALYEDAFSDVPSFVRERLEAGLLVECQRGNFRTDLGYIQVYTAPPSLEQNIQMPCVTVELESEDPSERAIGEDLDPDEYLHADDEFFETEGWLADVKLSIVGWSLNSDERVELRKALRRIIIANLPVFDSKGFMQVGLSMQDTDALNGEYNSPMYQVMATFSCVAPVRVGRRYGADEIVSTIEIRSNNG